MPDLTLGLNQLDRGEAASADRLLRLVYAELRRIAASRMSRETGSHTLQPTLLVHDAWLRLAGTRNWNWRNRAHFYGAAAEAMRRILIDRARRRRAQRRGGGQAPVTLDGLDPAAPAFDDDRWLALDEALEKLAAEDPAKARFVRLRFFAGLSLEEAALASGISPATAKRWWAFSRAWLFEEMRGP
ncbi:MAG: RNA polymerase subunit sigma [Verrucomicrobia bacterium]|nr:RNA polymerase subunit sigma [Verrucomicrobiota bacterium]